MSIHGIKVLGTRHEIPEILKAIAVDEVLIAIPSVRSEDIRAVMEIMRNAGGPAKVKILPEHPRPRGRERDALRHQGGPG